MKFLTWNVNGLRAIMNKGFSEYIAIEKPDVIALQEVKMSADITPIELDGYVSFYNHAERKGYSGVALFSSTKPIAVIRDELGEGRVIALEFDRFYVLSVYAPNAGRGIERKTAFDSYLLDFFGTLDSKKPVIAGGDFNAARCDIDVYSPELDGKPGYTKEERADIERLFSASFTDVFRYLFPYDIQYTWWSYQARAREKNEGMRIDYIITSDRIRNRINNMIIDDVKGSDHAPLILDIAY